METERRKAFTLLVSWLARTLDTDMRYGFEEVNQALKLWGKGALEA